MPRRTHRDRTPRAWGGNSNDLERIRKSLRESRAAEKGDDKLHARRRIMHRYAMRTGSGTLLFCRPVVGEARGVTKKDDGKVMFESAEVAEAAATELIELMKTPFRGYQCRRGDHWHLTSQYGSSRDN